MHRIRLFYIVAAMFATVIAVGCSDSVRRLSPAGPTPTAAVAPQGGETSGTMARTGADVVADWAARVGWAAVGELEAEGTGVISAVAGVCPDKTITIQGVPVVVNATTDFVGQATCAGLTVGRTVRVRAVLTPMATGLLVSATRIWFQGGPEPPTAVEVSGVVASFTGICPALTMTLRGTGVVVVTSATTRFEPAGGCASIAVGSSIAAEGTRNSAGQLDATNVRVRNDGGRTVGGEGTVGAVTGICPAVTMVIQGARIATTAATIFVNGACSDLRPGAQVYITGEMLADGSVVATRIEIRRLPGRPVSGDGPVSSVTGTCPSVTMIVRGYPVTTSAATVFTGGTCASIRPGVKVDVTGTETAGVIAATAVVIDAPGRRDDGF